MNGEPTADPRTKLADLEQLMYEHVRDAIDFEALYLLEQLLWGLLDQRKLDDHDGELARTLIVDAVTRAVRDPDSYFRVSPPPGITKDEEKAAAFDPACPFCQFEARQRAHDADPVVIAEQEAEEASLRELYGAQAQRWREEHAEAIEIGKPASGPLIANERPCGGPASGRSEWGAS